MGVAQRELKTQGMSLFINGLSGEFPTINRGDGYNELVLTENQILHGQNFFLELLESEPGEVRIKNSSQMFLPVIYKKYWVYAAAAVVLGAIVGASFKGALTRR